MTAWTRDELEKIVGAEEIQIAPRRSEGTQRAPTRVWIVRVGDELYVRSWRGQERAWYGGRRARRESHIFLDPGIHSTYAMV